MLNLFKDWLVKKIKDWLVKKIKAGRDAAIDDGFL